MLLMFSEGEIRWCPRGARHVSLPFVLARSLPRGLLESYGANLYPEPEHLCPAAVFTNVRLERSKAVCDPWTAPWAAPSISQSRTCEAGMLTTALVSPGCSEDYVGMFIDSVWHTAALRKL